MNLKDKITKWKFSSKAIDHSHAWEIIDQQEKIIQVMREALEKINSHDDVLGEPLDISYKALAKVKELEEG